MGITSYFDSIHLLNEIRHPKICGHRKSIRMFSKLVVRFTKYIIYILKYNTIIYYYIIIIIIKYNILEYNTGTDTKSFSRGFELATWLQVKMRDNRKSSFKRQGVRSATHHHKTRYSAKSKLQRCSLSKTQNCFSVAALTAFKQASRKKLGVFQGKYLDYI